VSYKAVSFETSLFPSGGDTTATVDDRCFPVRGILSIREQGCVGNNTVPSATVTNKPFPVCLSIFSGDIRHLPALKCSFQFSKEVDVAAVVSFSYFLGLLHKNIGVDNRINIIMVVTPVLLQ